MDQSCRPARAIVLAASFPLFLGALLGDWAYSFTYEIQWKNFASWLIVGGLFALSIAIIAQAIALIRRRHRFAVASLLLMIATFVVGFVDALVHAKDAWASMPAALVLSIVTTVLALVAAWLGLTPQRSGASA